LENRRIGNSRFEKSDRKPYFRMQLSAMQILFGGLAALFLFMSFGALFHLRWARRLPALNSLPEASGENRTRCSVVVAARNEETRIATSIGHLLEQATVPNEVIVVDDRSTDRTGEILECMATKDPRLRILHVTELPDDWLGKCYACHLGAGQATGDWILFTDADCWLKPDVILRALRLATREQVEHITLTAGVVPETLAIQAWHLAFLFSLANWISAVNRDKPGAYVGMGAFNMVRTDVYRACGGYEALRLTVLDDVKLGLLVRRAGKRTRAFLGGDDVQCHWGHTLGAMIKITEKNYFAAIDYRTVLALSGAVVACFVLCLTLIGPFTGTWAGFAVPLAGMTIALPAGVCARRLGWGIYGALLAPLVIPVLLYAMVNSALVTLRQGGIRWRDRFYPLGQLRAGTVR
jgi:hypothetical protein